MILVTGGAGFIGSNLVAGLGARGVGDIAICDRFGRDDKWRNVAKRELADIIAPERLLDYLDGRTPEIEAIFHLGAISSTTEADVDLIVDNNFRFSLALWEWCAARGVRLIYASSAATYGDGGQGFDDDASTEALARLRPLNPYGWSKHAVDRRVVRLVANRDPAPPQWVGLKFFNVYGPNEYHKEGQISVVYKNFLEIEETGRAVLFRSHRPDYADGGQLRDFIWVGDCVEVMLWLYDNPAVSGLFNVGTGRARSFSDLAAAVYKSMNRPPDIQYVDMPSGLRERYQYCTQAETSRLRAAGYLEPFTELEDGVARYVTGHLATDDPYV